MRDTVLAIPDTRSIPGWLDLPPWVGEYRPSSVLLVPLIIDGQPVGSFAIYRRQQYPYTDHHVRVSRRPGRARHAGPAQCAPLRGRAGTGTCGGGSGATAGDFVASVSHELRTPLAAIVGLCRVAADLGPAQRCPRLDQIDHIVLAASRQQRLVADLLLLSQAEGARLAPPCTPILLGTLVLSRLPRRCVGSYRGQVIELDGSGSLHVLAHADRTVADTDQSAGQRRQVFRPRVARSW